MKILKLILLGTLSFAVVGCGAAEKTELTKTEVKQRKKDGDTTDYCEKFGWYDDGVCDSFCKDPDPECSVNCLAEPVCGPGTVQVEACPDGFGQAPDPGAGRADAAPLPPSSCNAVTICGSTIYCQDENIACLAIALECPQGSTQISGECPADASCTIIDDGCTQILCLEQTGVPCGGNAFADAAPIQECLPTEFCKYEIEDACAASGEMGVCALKPEACTEEYAPVCGCDGNTYGNGCSAHSSGVSIASIGECASACRTNDECNEGQTCVDGSCTQTVSCGGFVGDTCGADEFCDYEIGDFCGAADATGTCQLKPDACAQAIVDPVCGCDGQTYLTACDANVAGVSVAAEGECPTTCASDADCSDTESCVNGTCQTDQVVCGGNSPNPVRCGVGEFCLIAPADLCGAADAPGVCTSQPMNCPAVYIPVCGCDNVTYGNECTAHANGVSVASPGVCPPN